MVRTMARRGHFIATFFNSNLFEKYTDMAAGIGSGDAVIETITESGAETATSTDTSFLGLTLAGGTDDLIGVNPDGSKCRLPSLSSNSRGQFNSFDSPTANANHNQQNDSSNNSNRNQGSGGDNSNANNPEGDDGTGQQNVEGDEDSETKSWIETTGAHISLGIAGAAGLFLLFGFMNIEINQATTRKIGRAHV